MGVFGPQRVQWSRLIHSQLRPGACVGPRGCRPHQPCMRAWSVGDCVRGRLRPGLCAGGGCLSRSGHGRSPRASRWVVVSQPVPAFLGLCLVQRPSSCCRDAVLLSRRWTPSSSPATSVGPWLPRPLGFAVALLVLLLCA